VPFYTPTYPLDKLAFPVLARNRKHHGGTDIIYCKNRFAARRALKRGRAYFTRYIPSKTEYRVWVYRGRHLGTYEKVLARPEEKHKLIGRNYGNGYAFQLVSEHGVPRASVDLAINALNVLRLDFGGVDVLIGNNAQAYILEVNTAPGVEGPGRQVIQALARRIAKWEAAGYPGRNYE
jgi:glutathione synthase/RimK-type ligase-like ATP-grasp enzyme